MFNYVPSYSRIMVASMHKGAQKPLHLDCIASSAVAYALNKGDKGQLDVMVHAANHLENGNARAPSKGSNPYRVNAIVSEIFARAESVGAWAHTAKITGLDRDARRVLANEFATIILAEFVAMIDADEVSRKQKAQDSKDAKSAAAAEVQPVGDAQPVELTYTGNIDADHDALALATLCTMDVSGFIKLSKAEPVRYAALRSLIDAASVIVQPVADALASIVAPMVDSAAATVAPASVKGKRAAKREPAMV